MVLLLERSVLGCVRRDAKRCGKDETYSKRGAKHTVARIGEETMIRVELDLYNAIHLRSEAEVQFWVRQKLRTAGIPLGPWDTSTVQRGVLTWWDEPEHRVFVWKEAA